MSHTPGPWRAHQLGQYPDQPVIRPDYGPFTANNRVKIADVNGGRSECDDNARLIALAPALATILRELMDTPEARRLPIHLQAKATALLKEIS